MLICGHYTYIYHQHAYFVLARPCQTERLFLNSDLVVPILRDISDPGQCIVSTLLNYFKVANLNPQVKQITRFLPTNQPVSYLDPRDSEIGDLKLDADRFFSPLTFSRFDRRESKVSPHDELLLTRILLDLPHEHIFFWQVPIKPKKNNNTAEVY